MHSDLASYGMFWGKANTDRNLQNATYFVFPYPFAVFMEIESLAPYVLGGTFIVLGILSIMVIK